MNMLRAESISSNDHTEDQSSPRENKDTPVYSILPSLESGRSTQSFAISYASDNNKVQVKFRPAEKARRKKGLAKVAPVCDDYAEDAPVLNGKPSNNQSQRVRQICYALHDPTEMLYQLHVDEEEFTKQKLPATKVTDKKQEEEEVMPPIQQVDLLAQPEEVVQRKTLEKERNRALEEVLQVTSVMNEFAKIAAQTDQDLKGPETERQIELKEGVIDRMRNAAEGVTSSVPLPEDNVSEYMADSQKWAIGNFNELIKEHVYVNDKESVQHSRSGSCQSFKTSSFQRNLNHQFQPDSAEELKKDPCSSKRESCQLNGSRSASAQLFHSESSEMLVMDQSKRSSGSVSYPGFQRDHPATNVLEKGPNGYSEIDQETTSEPKKPEPKLKRGLTLSVGNLFGIHKRNKEGKMKSDAVSTLVKMSKNRRQTMKLKGLFSSNKTNSEANEHFESHSLQKKTMYLLILLGSVASLVESGLNRLVGEIQDLSALARNSVTSYAAGFGVYVALSLALAAASAFITHRFDPVVSPGGGIPVMKYIIGSSSVEPLLFWLQLRSLVVKFFGLLCAIGCPALSVGREGPFVHMAAIIANQLMLRISLFKEIHNSSSLRTQIFSSACAVGVASAFTAPIGGILFSIEVTRTYYLLANYWKAYSAAVSGFLLIRLIAIWEYGTVSATTSFFDLIDSDGTGAYSDNDFFETSQLPFIIILAIIMGLLGPVYIKCLMATKRFIGKAVKPRPQMSIFSIVFIQACIFYNAGAFFRVSMKQGIIDLLKFDTLPSQRWGSSSSWVLGNLFIYFAVRVLLTMVSVSLPLPVGDFMPLFAAGAAFGRFFGMVVQLIFPSLRVMPSVYAICGAAAIVGSTTQTFSTAVIALEFTWLFQFQMQILISVLISVTISMHYSVSIYDATMAVKGMVHLQPLRKEVEFRMKAKDIMVSKPDLVFLSTKMKYSSVIHILKTSKHLAYPIVNNEEEMIFLGCVARQQLRHHLFKYFKLNECLLSLTKELPGEFDDFLFVPKHPDKKLKQSYKYFKMMKQQSADTLNTAVSSSIKTIQKAGNLKRQSSGCSATSSTSPQKKVKDIKRKLQKAMYHNRSPKLQAAVDLTLEDKSVIMYPTLLETEFDVGNASEVSVDPSAFTIPEFMSAEQIYVLFEMLRCKRLFITSFYGTLVGVISPPIFSEAIRSAKKES